MSRCVKVVWASFVDNKDQHSQKRSPSKEVMATFPGSTSFTLERNLLLHLQAAEGEVDSKCYITLSEQSNIVFLTRRGRNVTQP